MCEEGKTQVRYSGLTPQERVELFDGIINGRMDTRFVPNRMIEDAEAYYDLRIETMTTELRSNWTDAERRERDIRFQHNVGPGAAEAKRQSQREAKKQEAKERRELRILEELADKGPQIFTQLKSSCGIQQGSAMNKLIKEKLVLSSGRHYSVKTKRNQTIYRITSKGLNYLNELRRKYADRS